MSGAHQMSREWVLSRVKPGWYILDAGSGGGWLSKQMAAKGASVLSVDLDPSRAVDKKPDLIKNLENPWTWAKDSVFDAVVSTYCLQHLLGREALAWAEVGRVLKKGGYFLATGRHSHQVPYFEWTRNDPLRGDNRDSLEGLASASGLRIVEHQSVHYDEQGYKVAPSQDSNAWAISAMSTKGGRQ